MVGTTKFPAKAPADWGRATFETTMWMLHLWGGSVWIGGLLGLVALVVPGAIPAGRRGEFWSPAIF
jgi:putative copper export protein